MGKTDGLLMVSFLDSGGGFLEWAMVWGFKAGAWKVEGTAWKEAVAWKEMAIAMRGELVKAMALARGIEPEAKRVLFPNSALGVMDVRGMVRLRILGLVLVMLRPGRPNWLTME